MSIKMKTSWSRCYCCSSPGNETSARRGESERKLAKVFIKVCRNKIQLRQCWSVMEIWSCWNIADWKPSKVSCSALKQPISPMTPKVSKQSFLKCLHSAVATSLNRRTTLSVTFTSCTEYNARPPWSLRRLAYLFVKLLMYSLSIQYLLLRQTTQPLPMFHPAPPGLLEGLEVYPAAGDPPNNES